MCVCVCGGGGGSGKGGRGGPFTTFMPAHATPPHATPTHATPPHATPTHATATHATPAHTTPAHAATIHHDSTCPLCHSSTWPYRLPAVQVRLASPQLIVLDSMVGWGVNGSLVTLLPDQPLPALPPPAPLSSSSQGLSAGAIAGIVVGSIVGTALLVGGALLLLRR